MRLIDADEMFRWMESQKMTLEQWSMKIAIENYVDEMKEADAVPVIRCKDCKYYDEEDPNSVCGRLCVYFAKPDDFCSRGEKRR